MRTRRPRILRATSPDALARFFDQQVSSLQPKVNVSNLDPRPRRSVRSFSRFAETQEQQRDHRKDRAPQMVGGIFGNPALAACPLPQTAEQVDVLVDAVKEGLPAGHGFVMDEPNFHPYRGIRRAKTAHIRLPPALGMPEFLLTPKDRRDILEFQTRNARARKIIRKAKADAHRLKAIMRNQHPNGVIGMDSPAIIESEVYGVQARRLAAERSRRDHALAQRRALLSLQTNSIAARGFDFLRHDCRPRTAAATVGGTQGRNRNDIVDCGATPAKRYGGGMGFLQRKVSGNVILLFLSVDPLMLANLGLAAPGRCAR